MKNDDFLNVFFHFDDHKKHKITYEIDSLKKKFTINGLSFFIITRLSGNLRFIHLMSSEQMQKFRRDKKRERERQQQELAYTNFESKGNAVQTEHFFYISHMILNLHGIGLSLVDFQPREICYISFYGLELSYFTVSLALVNPSEVPQTGCCG